MEYVETIPVKKWSLNKLWDVFLVLLKSKLQMMTWVCLMKCQGQSLKFCEKIQGFQSHKKLSIFVLSHSKSRGRKNLDVENLICQDVTGEDIDQLVVNSPELLSVRLQSFVTS